MVTIDSLKTTSVNLPLVGGVSLAGVVLIGGIIYFLSRRKKSVKLTF